jgi:hypothetical protein
LAWNCRHLANPHLQKGLRTFMVGRGLVLPEICTRLILREIERMKANPILEEVFRFLTFPLGGASPLALRCPSD